MIYPDQIRSLIAGAGDFQLLPSGERAWLLNPQRRVAFLPFVRTSLKSLINNACDFEPKTIGELFLKRRLILELTQAEVGKLFNVSPETILDWEKGYSEPKNFQIPTLIEFLGFDPINLIPISIAEHLQNKRRKLGWTQKMAARNLGVDPCTWSRWEGGGTIMMYKHRKLIASFLGINEEMISKTMRKRWNKRHRNLAVQTDKLR